MRAVILTGGKGDRLRPLTLKTKKAYLPLGNRRIIDYVLANLPLEMCYDISQNDRGAVAAVAEALTGNEPVMVIAGDNYFTENLDNFVAHYSGEILLAVYDLGDKELAKQCGVVALDATGRISHFIEKPPEPPSTLVSTGIYIFPPKTFEAANSFASDFPSANIGQLINHLMLKWPTFSYILSGTWFDIGTHESYRRAQEAIKTRSNAVPFRGRTQ